MSRRDGAGSSASAERVRAVLKRLDREGSTPVDSRNPEAPDFRTVSISTEEGVAIRRWVRAEDATCTIEVGLAYGFSALHLCEGLLLNGNPARKHVAMDPFQAPPHGYAGQGLEILEEAGLGPMIEFHADKSQIVLPRFLREGRQFDLAFVDGNHRFDAVFLDLYYLGHLVRKGGIIILDDYDLPGIAKAVSFYVKNLRWSIEETSPRDTEHQWIVLRTSPDHDMRDFRYFVDF